jgi:hypothetical protein
MKRLSILGMLVVVACGGGTLTLSEYAAQGTAVVTVMEERIAALDVEWDSGTPTVERARSYWDRRIDARVESLEGLQDLNPPDSISELHATGMGLYERLIAAEEALAARVASFETATEREEWWNTAEAQTVTAVNDEVDAFCRVFQAMYDATVERLVFSDSQWIPPEMKEVVQIDIGCQ